MDLSASDAENDHELAKMKVNRFLQSMPQHPQHQYHTPRQAGSSSYDVDKELLLENRSLHQRISALQRTESQLLSENGEMVRQYNQLKQHHENRKRQLREEALRREQDLEEQIQQLREQVTRQKEQMLNITAAPPQPPLIAQLHSDESISLQLAELGDAWQAWAQDFASHDIGRLSTGLHLLQQIELCDAVKGFVKLTGKGQLPDEILQSGAEMVQIILHAMLANFICTEALASPFWVFNAISSNDGTNGYGGSANQDVPPLTAVMSTPGGFSFDLSNLEDRSASSFSPRGGGSSRFPPPLITSMSPQSFGSVSSPTENLASPLRSEMENMSRLLALCKSNSPS